MDIAIFLVVSAVACEVKEGRTGSVSLNECLKPSFGIPIVSSAREVRNFRRLELLLAL